MTDEEFESKLEDVVSLLRVFHRLRDRTNKKRFRSIIRAEIVEMTRID